MSTVVPLLEKKLGAPAGVVVLAEIDSALLFPHCYRVFGQTPKFNQMIAEVLDTK